MYVIKQRQRQVKVDQNRPKVCVLYAKKYTGLEKYTTAQCAFWVVRWPCGQMAIAVKTLSHGKTIVLRLFFLYCFRKKTLKLVSLFIFRHWKHYFWNTQNWSKWPGNPKFRVWKSRFPWKSSFPSNRTSWDKYMLNDISRHKF